MYMYSKFRLKELTNLILNNILKVTCRKNLATLCKFKDCINAMFHN